MVDAPDPIDLAARALRYRDRSRRQIDDRLQRAGVKDDERADALDTLERVGYVDDARYASARAASLADRGFGDDAIRHLLEGEGAPVEAIAAAVEALAPERERAERLARKQGRTERVSARLQRKGFSLDVLEAVFGGAFADTDDAA